MKNLPIFNLQSYDHLVQPEEFNDVKGSTSALSVLSDFRRHKPPMIDGHELATNVIALMRTEDIYVKLVIDTDMEFVGVVSQEDLSEHHLLQKQAQLGLSREDLSVQDLMHNRGGIRAIGYEDFKQACVDDIVRTLKKYHQDYLLVVDQGAHHIRGIVSSYEIARRLHSPIAIEKAVTFSDIFAAVRPA